MNCGVHSSWYVIGLGSCPSGVDDERSATHFIIFELPAALKFLYVFYRDESIVVFGQAAYQ
jgi:hypothetical protein